MMTISNDKQDQDIQYEDSDENLDQEQKDSIAKQNLLECRQEQDEINHYQEYIKNYNQDLYNINDKNLNAYVFSEWVTEDIPSAKKFSRDKNYMSQTGFQYPQIKRDRLQQKTIDIEFKDKEKSIQFLSKLNQRSKSNLEQIRIGKQNMRKAQQNSELMNKTIFKNSNIRQNISETQNEQESLSLEDQSQLIKRKYLQLPILQESDNQTKYEKFYTKKKYDSNKLFKNTYSKDQYTDRYIKDLKSSDSKLYKNSSEAKGISFIHNDRRTISGEYYLKTQPSPKNSTQINLLKTSNLDDKNLQDKPIQIKPKSMDMNHLFHQTTYESPSKVSFQQMINKEKDEQSNRYKQISKFIDNYYPKPHQSRSQLKIVREKYKQELSQPQINQIQKETSKYQDSIQAKKYSSNQINQESSSQYQKPVQVKIKINRKDDKQNQNIYQQQKQNLDQFVKRIVKNKYEENHIKSDRKYRKLPQQYQVITSKHLRDLI